MSCTKTAVSAGVLLVAGALLAGAGLASPHAPRAAQPPGDGCKGEDVAELERRVARLEAEVAELRKALRQAGGVPENAADVKNVREVAKVRSADLLQRAQNAHATLREVMNARAAGPALQNKINDLNNELSALWLALAGSGLGRDPYLDHIQLSGSGFGGAKSPPDYGIPGPYVGIGLPRLHERYLEASGAKGKAAETARSDFRKLVQAYSNPAVYPHRAFNERATEEYRAGKGLFTAQYAADLAALDQWLSDLEAALGRVPGYFEDAP
jgi:hypothetical protein